MVWYFMLKIFHLSASKRNFISPLGHVISSISVRFTIDYQIAFMFTIVTFSVPPLYNNKSSWDSIRMELKDPEFELLG